MLGAMDVGAVEKILAWAGTVLLHIWIFEKLGELIRKAKEDKDSSD